MATPGPSLRRPLGQRLTVFDLAGAAITHLPYPWTRVLIDSGCNGRPVGSFPLVTPWKTGPVVVPRTRDRRSARWPGTGEGYRNVEGHKFGFGAVNCTASVATGPGATETECVEGVGGELVSACMTHSHGRLHGIPFIIPCNACAVRWLTVGNRAVADRLGERSRGCTLSCRLRFLPFLPNEVRAICGHEQKGQLRDPPRKKQGHGQAADHSN